MCVCDCLEYKEEKIRSVVVLLFCGGFNAVSMAFQLHNRGHAVLIMFLHILTDNKVASVSNRQHLHIKQRW